ncbi:TonB-dependent receptor [Oceanicoccus sp. KOV_DT_Chl]|uniref:TonB-dependent receptor domain-containing protein n=1 Tax=Oceanicoccus sp. KOV_DT_Chl TaxID=1904639 RepID=UPI000C79B7E3|nr:TonB-dependent receptor [Oceanicoccus sp. KOV_DT_Chl]
MVYFTFSEGFRVGGVNRAIPRRDGSVVDDQFASDDLESYELGLKSKWADNRVEFNAALYAVDWHDIQISQTDDLTAFDYTENAGEAEIRGVEGEFRWLMNEYFDVSAGVTYIDHEITEGEDKGSELPLVSNENYYLSARYGREVFDTMSMYARADWTYTGGYQTDTNPSRPSIDSYEILNFQVGLQHQDWEVTAFVKNALDNDAVIDEVRPGNSAPLGRVTRLTPRTIGGSVKWYF